MRSLRLILCLFFIAVVGSVYSQNVGIGTTNPASGAILDLVSTDKGLLIPRLEASAVANPVQGLMIFQPSTNAFMYHNGSAWEVVGGKVVDVDGDTKIEVVEDFFRDTIRYQLDGQEVINMSRNQSGDLMVEPIFEYPGNTYYGWQSGQDNQIGAYNTAFGSNALAEISQGSANTSFGARALQKNKIGNGNVAIGYETLNFNEKDSNTIIGHQALLFNNGSRNTAIGYDSGINNYGSNNIFIGAESGSNEAGSNKLYIENSAADSANALIYGEFDNDYLRMNANLEVFANGIGVRGEGGFQGIRGDAIGTTGPLYGVGGNAASINPSGTNYGVYGWAENGATNYSIYGENPGSGANDWAGYFDGKAYIADSLKVDGYSYFNNELRVEIVDSETSKTGISALVWAQSGGTDTYNGLYGISNSGNNGTNIGVRGLANGGATNYGVYGLTFTNSGNSWAGYFEGKAYVDDSLKINGQSHFNDDIRIEILNTTTSKRAVRAQVKGQGSGNYMGVSGVSDGTGGSNYGVYGSARLGASNYALYGAYPGSGANDWAGYFDGKAYVDDSLKVNGVGHFNGNAYVGDKFGVGIEIGNFPLNVKAIGAGNDLVKFYDNSEVGVWHLKLNSNGDLGFTETNVADNRLVLKAGGNIGIGLVPTTNRLEVNGDASKSTAGDWLANSDRRLKKNIKAITSATALDNLLKLQGITYEWNDDKTGNKRPEGIHYGFTAQNIADVYPTLVQEDAMGYLQTAYGTFDAMTVEAMRALNDKINEQESIIAAQETRIARMESALVSLLTKSEAPSSVATKK